MPGTQVLDDRAREAALEHLRTLGEDADAIAQHVDSTIRPSSSAKLEAVIAELAALTERAPGRAARGLVLGKTLGEGGMGVVRAATQESIGRTVAVKTLRETERTPAAMTRLLLEGRVTGSLEHPNIVPVHDIALDAEGTPYVVLKHIEGTTWSALLRDPRAVTRRFGVTDPFEWHVRTLMQVCNAVHFAHSRGVVHRDLKPDNVMIGAFGETYVLDWGIAVGLREDHGGLPLARNAHQLAGTPVYMAPEMLDRRMGPVSERTDVYLLGAILHQVLAGRPPHQADSLALVFESILSAERPSLPGAPIEALKIRDRAMALSPGDRYATAEELRLDLQEHLDHRASTRLAHSAERSLLRLTSALARGETASSNPTKLYDYLGEVRFGYRAALDAWDGNDDARNGLEVGIGAMIEFELGRGDAAAAARLLAELPSPPKALAERVEAARTAQEADARRVTELRRLGESLDASVGRPFRARLAIALGVVWTSSPLVAYAVTDSGRTLSHRARGLHAAAVLLAAAAVALAARRTVLETLVNRRVIASVLIALGAGIALEVGAASAGVSARDSLVIDSLLYGIVAAMLAIHVDGRLAIGAVAYLASYLLGSVWESQGLLFLAGANLVMSAIALWVYGTDRG